MTYDNLLAKSRGAAGEKTLKDHSRDVLHATKILFGTLTNPTRLGAQWLRFFRVKNWEHFSRCIEAAALFHDWGKANSGFQDAVHAGGEQVLRHEHLGGLLLALTPVAAKLKQNTSVDWDVVLGAVISHHLKVDDEHFAEPRDVARFVKILSEHPQFADLLALIAKEVGVPLNASDIPRFWEIDDLGSGGFQFRQHRDRVLSHLRSFDRSLRRANGGDRNRLMMAVRAALIVADALGSAMFRVGIDTADFCSAAFDDRKLCTAEYVWKEIINPRVKQLEIAGTWRGWSEFQDACDSLPSPALLIAPCGSGKSLAAWRWIAAHCGEGVQRVIFLYPTRATATEGFRDYVSWAPDTDAALVHGSAEYDLQGMFSSPNDLADPRAEKSFEVEQKLYALAFWDRHVFSATVDQFMAFMQYHYGSMCLLPMLADSVVVVDEIHSFDRGMFAALKAILKNFDVPILCMTASLPSLRRQELTGDCGLALYDEKPGQLAVVAGESRYHVSRVREDEVFERIRDALAQKKRVLWVVNKVRRAQEAARRAASGALPVESCDLHCYHSRFRLDDRRDRHQDTVRAFQRVGEPRAVLAITTQVCEMSLDMDADVLITEFAPITALIQRMGRCNRAAIPRAGAGVVLLYSPVDTGPYDKDDLLGVDEFVSKLCALGSVKQTDLETLLEDAPAVRDLPKRCRFLESGPFAMAREETFRDGDEFTVPAVLDTDLLDYLRLSKCRKSTAGLIVPVPRKFARADPKLPRYLSVAPGEHYEPKLGFCDRPIIHVKGA